MPLHIPQEEPSDITRRMDQIRMFAEEQLLQTQANTQIINDINEHLNSVSISIAERSRFGTPRRIVVIIVLITLLLSSLSFYYASTGHFVPQDNVLSMVISSCIAITIGQVIGWIT